ncbi:hypothetical protein, partial [Enterobacter hormaechei]
MVNLFITDLIHIPQHKPPHHKTHVDYKKPNNLIIPDLFTAVSYKKIPPHHNLELISFCVFWLKKWGG